MYYFIEIVRCLFSPASTIFFNVLISTSLLSSSSLVMYVLDVPDSSATSSCDNFAAFLAVLKREPIDRRSFSSALLRL